MNSMNSISKLTAEKCRSHVARLRRYERENLYQYPFEIEMLEAFELALSVLEQRERDGGEWIEWDGNRAPFNAGEIVQIRLKDGDVDTGPWSHFHWGRNCMNPIIAYRIIPERGAHD